MKPVKVLHLAPPGFGGIDAYIFSHYKYMDQSKFQFSFLTQNRGLAGAEQYQSFRYNVCPLPATAAADRAGFIQYVTEVLRGGYDVFHIHTSYWTGFLLEELAQKAGIKKVIVHSHSTFIDEPDGQKREFLLRQHEKVKRTFLPELATNFWACSQPAADWLFGPQIPQNKIRIMKNAIEVERFQFNSAVRERIRAELGFDDKTLVLGTAGRLSFQKNHAFLVDAFTEFHRLYPHSKLLIIGDGELRSDLERQIRDNHLERDTLLPGWKTNVEEYLQAMDIFLLPSRFEGLGIAAVEAAASGLPCIVSDQVPSEVSFSDNIRHMPLEISVWNDALNQMAQMSVDRRQGIDAVRAAGYDVRQQAKQLEVLYEA